jgi:hypothetical protein
MIPRRKSVLKGREQEFKRFLPAYGRAGVGSAPIATRTSD